MARYLIILCMLLGCTGSAQSQSDSDKAEILETFKTWNRGWAERDAELAVSDYSENTDWTNAFGDRFVGKAELLRGLKHIFSLDFVMAGTSAENEFTDIVFIRPDVAIVRSNLVRAGQRTSDGKSMPDRHISHLRVYEKNEGEWLIVSHLISQAHPKR